MLIVEASPSLARLEGAELREEWAQCRSGRGGRELTGKGSSENPRVVRHLFRGEDQKRCRHEGMKNRTLKVVVSGEKMTSKTR